MPSTPPGPLQPPPATRITPARSPRSQAVPRQKPTDPPPMTPQASDVVFVFPPAPENLGAFKNHLGVAYLRAVLARQGITTTQYLQDSPGTVTAVAAEILQHRPEIVGFTVYDANFSLALALARRLKQQHSGLRVVFGGPTATFGATQILQRHGAVDACVIGEAEETGPRIFRRLLDGGDFNRGLPGLAVRHEGVVVCPDLPPLVGSSHDGLSADSALDATPSPYLSGILQDGRPGVLTARGCTHHCQYCVFAALARKTLQLHSIGRVLEELDFIAYHQKRTGEHYPVLIHDDAFTLLPARAKQLCHAIATRDFRLELSCLTRADRIDDELLRLMRRAGFISISFGLESAVPSVLRATGKVRPPDWPDPDLAPEKHFLKQVRAGVHSAKRLGFHVGLSIILGLPSETSADAKTTLRFVNSLRASDYAHNFLSVCSGTPLFHSHDRFGIRCTTDSLGLTTTTEYPYDVMQIKPLRNCLLEQDVRFIRDLTLDALYACHTLLRHNRGIHTVVITSRELTPATASWLNRILNVGGSVLQVYPARLKRQGSVHVDSDRCTLNDADVPARYFLHLIPATTTNRITRWRVASFATDLYLRHQPALLSIASHNGPRPLLEWLTGRTTSGAVCDLTHYLSQPDELVRFIRRGSHSFSHGSLRRMPLPPSLKYPGRWLRGRAPCLPLTRLEVDETGTVRTCLHGEPIGVIGDTRGSLRRRLNVFNEDAERRRGCARCPNTHCPRCPFPGINDEVYCRIMTNQLRALGFLNTASVFSRLPAIIGLQRDKLGSD